MKKKRPITEVFAHIVLDLTSIVKAVGIVGGIDEEDKKEFVNACNSIWWDNPITVNDIDWEN